MEENQCLVLLIHQGYGLLWEKETWNPLKSKCMIFLHGEKEIQLQFHSCQYEYAFLQGNHTKSLIPQEKILCNPCFYQKAVIFFCSIWSSIDKYNQVDLLGITSSIYRLFSDLSHFLMGMDEENVQHKMVQKILDYIEQHYKENVTLQELADYLGYSKYYMLHVFSEVMGLSIHDYFIRRRLTQVKVLLMENQMTIESIAKECGFASDIALYKAFKNVYSITPGQFKKQVQLENRKKGRKE